MDFQNVPPVDIKVRDLSLSIEPSPSILEKFRLARSRQAIVNEGKQILQNVSLDVSAGSLMAIMGANGSGKVYIIVWMTLIRLHC